jgi:hypothetical protein
MPMPNDNAAGGAHRPCSLHWLPSEQSALVKQRVRQEPTSEFAAVEQR